MPVLGLQSLVSRNAEPPALIHVRRTQEVATSRMDVPAVVADELTAPLSQVRPGQTVAIAVGSRGITRIAEIIAAVVAQVRQAGGEPYLVPAMGSHGGATSQGQRDVLADLGITEDLAPIRSSMVTLPLGTVNGVHVSLAEEAIAADHVLVVNRVKSHTSFSGRIESGLAKMVAIGLGKQSGAEELHRMGPMHLEARLVAAYGMIASRMSLLGGLAITEGRSKNLLSLDFVDPGGIGGEAEAALLARARSVEARLPFAQIDVLVVDRMGKEISGTGMDTNVLGRRMVRGSPEPEGPQVTNVVVLELSEASEGNAVGLGLADFVPVSLLDRVDLSSTYANALTAGLQGVQRAQIPIVLATERDAVTAALMTAGVAAPEDLRIVRIASTLALDEFLVSANLLESSPDLERVVGSGLTPMFDDERLTPWPRPQRAQGEQT